MRRLVLLGTAGLAAALLVSRVARGCGGLDFEKMIERMPDNAPPKWVFRNISAIRNNTERILEMLEAERPPAVGEQVWTAA
jgi:hypothetical protein